MVSAVFVALPNVRNPGGNPSIVGGDASVSRAILVPLVGR
jgi:hypothetical protein